MIINLFHYYLVLSMHRVIDSFVEFITSDSPHCILRPQPDRSLGPFDVLSVFGNVKAHGNSPAWGGIISAITLLVLGYRVMFSNAARSLKQYSNLRFCVGIYCFITGIFFFALLTNLNIIVITFATLHNFIEWSMLANLLISRDLRRKYNAYAALFCWFVALVVMHIPDILFAFEFEEITGIWPDFLLIYVAYYLNITTRDKPDVNRKDAYPFFFEGAAWHLLQIITLLCQGFRFLSVEEAGILSFVTALPNYWYYSEFALRYDGFDKPYAMPLILGSFFGITPVLEDLTPIHVNDPEEVYETPVKYFTKKETQFKFAFLYALPSAIVLVAGPPLCLGLCRDVGYTCLAPENVFQITLYPPTTPKVDVINEISKRSMEPETTSLSLRVFEGVAKLPLEGYTLVLEKFKNKLTMLTTNVKFGGPKAPAYMFRYSNFAQVEGTKNFFDPCDDQFVINNFQATTKKYHFKKHFQFPDKFAGCPAKGVVGFTLASLSDHGTMYGLNAMAYAMRTRYQPGNIFYNVFFGGGNPGNNPGNNPFFDGSSGENPKVLVIEGYKDQQALTDHLNSATVDYVKSVAAVTSVPSSIVMSSYFEEILPNCE